MVKYYTDTLGKLPYDPWTTHPIPVTDLLACAKAQGVEFRPADILIIRAGFTMRFNGATQEERDALQGKTETLWVPFSWAYMNARNSADASRSAGIQQGEEMKRFLWDTHFAAVASDTPSLERWPTPEGVPHLHETLLGYAPSKIASSWI